MIVYANSFGGVFFFDDLGTIVRNANIRELTHLKDVFVPPADTPLAGRPLVQLSFAINYAIGGLNFSGYHFINLALHLTSAVLIYQLIRRIAPLPLAVATALIWTVHPLNSEVVNYTTQRTESMMAVCLLATLYFAALNWRVAAIIICAAGMLCKETMAVAPIAVVLYDWAGSDDVPFAELCHKRWPLYAGLAATWSVVGVMLVTHGQSLSGGFTTAQVSSWTYFLNQPALILRYLRLAFWPSDLVLYYGWPRALTIGQVWPQFVAVSLVGVAAIVALVKWRRIGAAAVWVFVLLGPTSSFLPISTEVGAERRMYLPLVGVIALAMAGIGWLAQRFGSARSGSNAKGWPLAVAAMATVLLGSATNTRNVEYSTSLGMAKTVLARWPSPYAEQMVGTELVVSGRHGDAIPHLRAAVPAYPPARYVLGQALFGAGQRAEAITELEAFQRDEPTLAVVPSRMLIAKAYGADARWPEAIAALEKVLTIEPNHVEAHGFLAEALFQQQRYADALPHYGAYLSANPGNADAWTNLGMALVQLKQIPEAVRAFRSAVDAAPQDARYRMNLERALQLGK